MGSSISGCKRRASGIDFPESEAKRQRFNLLEPKSEAGALRQTLLDLLISGGDERLLIDPATGLNKYNSSIQPVDANSIVRSSCTANPVTGELFEFAEETVRDLVQKATSGITESEIFETMMFTLRRNLRREWNLDEDISSSLVSSGTDAELLPVMFGVLRAQRAREEEDDQCDVITVLTAAGEVGSNTKLAATGKVCGDILPVQQLKALQDSNSADVKCKQPNISDNVFPLFGPIAAIDVPLRDEISGTLVTPEIMDNKVSQIVTTAVQSGHYKAVILHMVISCKTGHCVPSVNCVQKLAEQFPEVIPVVDACQMRGLTAYSVRRLTKLGFIVMCTGSKFYGGPPFSGAVFFPKKYTDELEDHLSKSVACRSCIKNSLLSGYICASTISTDWPQLRALLPQSPNFGLALRWSMALRNIREYHKIPEANRETIILNWVTGLRSLIRSNASGCVKLLDKTADEAIVDEAPENQIYGIGLPRTGTHSVAEALKLIGMSGMNKCILTLSRVKHVAPESQKVVGNFEVDNSLFRNYQKVFHDNPLAKFILTTRDDEAYQQSIERWNEKNQHRDDMSDVPKSTTEFQDEITEFFVHRRAAHRLLVVDVFKMSDTELWTKLMDFISPTPKDGVDRFDPMAAGVPFPRAVVQVAGNLTKGDDSKVIKTAGDGTSPNDVELLTGQINTIIPIVLEKKVLKNKGYRFERLNLEELKRLHLLLALDCSIFTPAIPDLSSSQQIALAKRCFIAQPVSLNLTTWGRAAYLGVLRFALGAVSVIEVVKQGQGAQELLEQDKVVIVKLEVLLQHWDKAAQWNVHMFQQNNARQCRHVPFLT